MGISCRVIFLGCFIGRLPFVSSLSLFSQSSQFPQRGNFQSLIWLPAFWDWSEGKGMGVHTLGSRTPLDPQSSVWCPVPWILKSLWLLSLESQPMDFCDWGWWVDRSCGSGRVSMCFLYRLVTSLLFSASLSPWSHQLLTLSKVLWLKSACFQAAPLSTLVSASFD